MSHDDFDNLMTAIAYAPGLERLAITDLNFVEAMQERQDDPSFEPSEAQADWLNDIAGKLGVA